MDRGSKHVLILTAIARYSRLKEAVWEPEEEIVAVVVEDNINGKGEIFAHVDATTPHSASSGTRAPSESEAQACLRLTASSRSPTPQHMSPTSSSPGTLD